MDISSDSFSYGPKKERSAAAKARSKEALCEAITNGVIESRQGQMYKSLCKGGEMTSREAYEYARQVHGIPSSTNGFGSRASELFDLGLIVPVGKRRCRYTGKNATVWKAQEGPAIARSPINRLVAYAYLAGEQIVRFSLIQEPLQKGETKCVHMMEAVDRRNSRIAMAAQN